jgi:Viral BACON domain
MFLLFIGILTLLVFFGSQLQVRTVLAVPSLTGGNPVPLGANTCAGSGCHVNIGSPGNAVVTGFPAGMTYTPGTPIPLTVTISDATQRRFGYELTARLVSNTATAAGTLAAGTNSNTGTNVVPVVQGLSNSSTFNFTWTPPSTAAGNVNFYLTGLAGSFPNADLYTAMYTLTPAAAVANPDFSLSATAATVVAGATGTSTLTVTPQNGFTGTIALSASGLPSGVTLSPTSVTGSGPLTLTASSTATTGTFPITLTGTSGSLSHTASFNLTLNSSTATKPDFSLSASPSSVTITQGSSGTSMISIAPLNGFNSSVSLSIPGLPSGVTAVFSPASTMGTSTLTLSASSAAASLTVGLTVTGTSGSLTHTTTVNLTVNAAGGTSSLTPSPSSLMFNYQGGGSMPPSQKVMLTTTGGPLTYSASTSGGPWLTASPTTGTTPGTIMVSVNPANMSAGTYSGTVQLSAPGANSSKVNVTLNITSRGCDDGCGGTGGMYAAPFVNDPSSSGTLTAQWVDLLGMPTANQSSTGNPGLVLSKNATAPMASQTGAVIDNVQGPLTELGFDYREGGLCTTTSPRFVVVTTDSVTHVVGGCSKGTITAAPMMGWKRVRFNLTDSAQTSPVILPGDSVSSITLVMDQGPEAGSGGLVVIDNIDINGTFTGKGSASRYRGRD